MDIGSGGIVGYSRENISFCSARCTVRCAGVGGGICGFSDHPISGCSFVGELIQRDEVAGASDHMARTLGGIVGYQVGRGYRYTREQLLRNCDS